ncbi:hypothetical protein [Aquella oligotrophica]|uniref:Uncharacterized protein n=1 Tax=Aquella oligotrophica TaxID=2067065 RepID=A0A2I7N7V9_9NEIS|nr:hypothetical protein [Aquella oligotrophica]AUR52520.1 hypothetical protein CUN60_09490 [Aquella oligotrophica]
MKKSCIYVTMPLSILITGRVRIVFLLLAIFLMNTAIWGRELRAPAMITLQNKTNRTIVIRPKFNDKLVCVYNCHDIQLEPMSFTHLDVFVAEVNTNADLYFYDKNLNTLLGAVSLSVTLGGTEVNDFRAVVIDTGEYINGQGIIYYQLLASSSDFEYNGRSQDKYTYLNISLNNPSENIKSAKFRVK